MNLLHEDSLGKTLDAINDALFFKKQIPQEEACRTARWIAGRQGLPTSYAGMFAPTNEDYNEGVRLFTGERISSRVGTAISWEKKPVGRYSFSMWVWAT